MPGPVQRARYVERNALRAGLTSSAHTWEYCSLTRRAKPERPGWLLPTESWPVSQFPDWLERVNEPEGKKELDALRRCVNRGQPYGETKWQAATAKGLSPPSLRDPWRPATKPKEGTKEK